MISLQGIIEAYRTKLDLYSQGVYMGCDDHILYIIHYECDAPPPPQPWEALALKGGT